MNCSMPGFPIFYCLPEFAQLVSIESVMPSNHLILCLPLLLPPSIFPSIRVFSHESALCDIVDHGMPGLPVHHQLPEYSQTHVHRVGDAIQPSHPLSFPSPPAFNLSQHQGLFQQVRWPKYWSFSFSISPSNEYLGLISLRMD